MKNNLLNLFYVLCLFSFIPSHVMDAKQISFRAMAFTDKMSTNSIFNLYQDWNGFVWIATANGIVRYDGYNTQIIRNDYLSPAQLCSNDIRCFSENKQHIWVGTAQGVTLIDKSTFKTQLLDTPELQNTLIRDMMHDKHGNVWIATDYKVFRFNENGQLSQNYTFPITVNRFFEDKDGVLWLLSTRGDIFQFDKRLDCFNKFATLKHSNLYQMTQDKQGIFWIATWGNGIWRFDPSAPNTEEMFQKQSLINPIRHLPETVFYDIIQDDSYGFIWALSHFRLYILRINEEGNLEEADCSLYNDEQFPADFYKTYSRVIKDKRGNLWLGAYDQGYIVSFKNDNITNYLLDEIKEKVGLDANIIYFNKDQNDMIWFNQARYGLCLYNEANGQISYGIGQGNKLYSKDVLSIIPSQKEDAVWLGGRLEFSSKVWKMTQKEMQISILEEYDLKRVDKSPGNITQLVEDHQGDLWIGTTHHLFHKLHGSPQITSTSTPIKGVVDLATDSLGNVWVCDKQEILQIQNTDSISVKMHCDASTLMLKESEFIERCCTHHDGRLWFTTSLGRLYQLDSTSGVVTDLTNEYDLQGDNILKLIIDQAHLWIICQKYVICHNLNEKKNVYYHVNDEHISISSIRYGAAFTDKEGNLYAGGHNGFIKISANQPSSNHIFDDDKVYITDVRTDGRSVLFSPIKKEANNSISQIKLMPNSRNIEIRFSSFPYEMHRYIKYAYKMDGVDEDWNYIENGEHSAFYNLLDKGEYTFKVKSTDINGLWNESYQQIQIVSLPMWYETRIAYVIYALLFALGIYWVCYIYIKRMEHKNQIKLQEELTQAKLNYFTGISHELFSPLATIACATDVLEEEKTYQESQIEILRANINRLKRLLQQILDFRKVESGKMTLLVEKGNITERVQSIIASNFQPLAHKKHIRLSSQIEEGIWGYLDFDKLDKILFNLLSNAIKYTHEYKNVKVIMKVVNKNGWRYLSLMVCDEGIGIDSKELKHIFTKFYHNKRSNNKETNGLGLSLTKDLITIHHGYIEVESKVNEGSIFSVELPIDKDVYSEEELFLSVDSTPEEMEDSFIKNEVEEIPHLLFIDDNPELRVLLEKLLGKKYHVTSVSEAEEGLNRVKKSLVDIIVCDVMMPGMNGLEFCSILKRNQQTSHIPIIMLTAKNDANAQIECYQAGAESFIAKPFEMKILQARIDNLLQTGKNRQRNFQAQYDADITDLDYQVFDEDFLQNAITCVEKHIQESDFGIERIASELGMSRSTLSRKLKVLTGLTPLDFVRNIKLKYACRLLKNKSANISDVAYYLGFSSPKYFTKCFKKEFGMTPSEYQSQTENE